MVLFSSCTTKRQGVFQSLLLSPSSSSQLTHNEKRFPQVLPARSVTPTHGTCALVGNSGILKKCVKHQPQGSEDFMLLTSSLLQRRLR